MIFGADPSATLLKLRLRRREDTGRCVFNGGRTIAEKKPSAEEEGQRKAHTSQLEQELDEESLPGIGSGSFSPLHLIRGFGIRRINESVYQEEWRNGEMEEQK